MRATTGNSGAKALRERLKKPEILIAPEPTTAFLPG